MNWTGNKIKYYDLIERIIVKSGKKILFDPFVGSVKVVVKLINTGVIDSAIVSDSLFVIPKILVRMKIDELQFGVNDYEAVSQRYHHFRNRGIDSDYYAMREDWNRVYIRSGKFDKAGIVMFDLLTVMCSNSLIRFGRNGNFNQGYRGGRGGVSFYQQDSEHKSHFFGSKGKRLKYFEKMSNQMNLMSLASKKITARVLDFRYALKFANRKMFIFLDPPYLSGWTYAAEWLDSDIDYFGRLIKLLIEHDYSFLAFSYLKKYGKFINPELMRALIAHRNSVMIEALKTKHFVGQSQKQVSDALEAIIYT